MPLKSRGGSILRRIDRAVFGRLIPDLPRLVERHIGADCDSLLDVGCGGPHSPITHFADRIRYTVGVDAFQPSIDEARREGKHSEYRCLGVLDIEKTFGPKSFDYVVALDLIEHLTRQDGERLLELMERVARRRVIIFTPNGFLPQAPYDGNEFQEHRSGWTSEEMRARGYRVWGVNGWKPLRGERAEPRWWPGGFWVRVSWLSQPLVERLPEHAFQILCVKDLT